MNREIVWTTQFKKDYKLALKRHLDIELLDNIIRSLSRGETLPEKIVIMHWQEIGQGTENATFCRTGFLFTVLMIMSLCSR